MTKEEILAYIMSTPANSNPAVLSSMLDSLGGDEPGPAPAIEVAPVFLQSTDENQFDVYHCYDSEGNFVDKQTIDVQGTIYCPTEGDYTIVINAYGISGLSESGKLDGNFAMVPYNEEINSVTFSGGTQPK